MSALERIQNHARNAGLRIDIDSHDTGILRVWEGLRQTAKLVGVIVIRNDRITYAELDGRIVAHDLRSFRIDRLSAVIKALDRRTS